LLERKSSCRDGCPTGYVSLRNPGGGGGGKRRLRREKKKARGGVCFGKKKGMLLPAKNLAKSVVSPPHAREE